MLPGAQSKPWGYLGEEYSGQAKLQVQRPIKLSEISAKEAVLITHILSFGTYIGYPFALY